MNGADDNSRTCRSDPFWTTITLDEEKFLRSFSEAQRAKTPREDERLRDGQKRLPSTEDTLPVAATAAAVIGKRQLRSLTAPDENDSSSSAMEARRKKKKPDFSFLLGDVGASCKPCDPYQGLTLNGRRITEEDLLALGPDDLGEGVLERNGEPLSIEELGDLLGFDKDIPMIDDIEY
jgi:hypothetical protein